jgi:hypothetical protein
MRWAARLAVHATWTAIVEVQDRIAANDKQSEYLKARRIIRDAGKNGITERDLGRAFNGEIDTKRRNDIIAQLIEDRHVVRREHRPRTGRPSTRLYLRGTA